MKKEYKKPVIEIEDIELSSLIATSPGVGSIDQEGQPIEEDDVAAKLDVTFGW